MTKKCIHYWIIDPPNGPTSTGVCKLCGATKQHPNEVKFSNSVPMQTRAEQEYNRTNAYAHIPFGSKGALPL